jgi:hypothetical protein
VIEPGHPDLSIGKQCALLGLARSSYYYQPIGENEENLQRLKAAEVRISWDGRGCALDNIFVERLWRSVKYEEIYIKEYQTVTEAI